MINKIRKYLGLSVKEDNMYNRPVILGAEHGVTYEYNYNTGPIAVMGHLSTGQIVGFEAQDWAPGIWAGSEGTRVRVVPSDASVAPWEDVIQAVNLSSAYIVLRNLTLNTGSVCIELLG